MLPTEHQHYNKNRYVIEGYRNVAECDLSQEQKLFADLPMEIIVQKLSSKWLNYVMMHHGISIHTSDSP